VKTPSDGYSLDDEARQRWIEEDAAKLMDCARRVESDHDIDATPQEAAWQLIELSEEYLSTPSRPLPEAVRTFPRPFYLSAREPLFFQHEIDAWLLQQADKRADLVVEGA